MTKKKFEPKLFRGKPRIYVGVAGRTNVFRLYVWDEQEKEYQTPARGKPYMARRQGHGLDGKRRRESQYFETLDEVNEWQAYGAASLPAEPQDDGGPAFGDIVLEWKKRRFSGLSMGSIEIYEKALRLWFMHLLEVPIRRITSAVVDRWIDWMKENVNQYGNGVKRQSFRIELTLLSTILGYYAEFHDEDTAFRNPLKRRHRQAIKVRNRKPVSRDFLEEQAEGFISQLAADRGPFAETFATVQYWQAHRVSETAALRWEDVRLDFTDPRKSRVYVSQHVIFLRGKGAVSKIEPGFKNGAGVKEQPMMPQVFAALARIRPATGGTGLIFRGGDPNVPADADFIEYQVIRYWYQAAFKTLGLPYSATHVLRHGGTRAVFNATGGDRAIACQQLGNSDPKTVDVYAVRSSTAYSDYVAGIWDKTIAANPGRKWSQTGTEFRLVKTFP